MFEIIFYEDKDGNSPIVDFILSLSATASTSKDARINLNKVIAYLNMLTEAGTWVGEPVTKHLDGAIWELRPLKNRLLYAFYKDDKFIILHCFVKKSKKIPKRELEQAKRNLEDYLERNP